VTATIGGGLDTRFTSSAFVAGDNRREVRRYLRAVAIERNVSEEERLDRIERHIKRLAEASAALQQELKIARQLAADRARAVRQQISSPPKRRRQKSKHR